MNCYGLTGGIGVGKSTVAKLFFEEGGIPVLDADEVARELRAPGGEAEAPILARFQTLDRGILRELISRDPKAKQDLEGILHPLIRKKSLERMKALESAHPHAPFLLYEATLLLEAGRKDDLHGVIVVTSPLPDRLSRIMERDKITKTSALALIEAQSPDDYRLKQADYHIQNMGTLEDLREQVRKILAQIQSA